MPRIDTGFLAWGGKYMLECQTCIRYVIVLAILLALREDSFVARLGRGNPRFSRTPACIMIGPYLFDLLLLGFL